MLKISLLKYQAVDQKCAFMGGLDLCYGRWDNQNLKVMLKGNHWKKTLMNSKDVQVLDSPASKILKIKCYVGKARTCNHGEPGPTSVPSHRVTHEASRKIAAPHTKDQNPFRRLRRKLAI